MSATIALALCPEAASRLWSRKGNPKKPSGQAELRIQRSKFREARDPIILGAKYWRGRNCTEKERELQKSAERSSQVWLSAGHMQGMKLHINIKKGIRKP